MADRPDVITIYRRLIAAAETGKGVRLTREEVEHMVRVDDAIRQAVWSADEELQDRGNNASI